MKKLVPLQNDTCPKTDPAMPFMQRPWLSAFGRRAHLEQVGAVEPEVDRDDRVARQRRHRRRTAGVVPSVITSGSYTDSAPVAGFRIVAWTNAPRSAALVISQPDAAGVIPSVPVSW